MAPRLFSGIIFSLTTIMLLTTSFNVNTSYQVFASAAGLEVIVRATTNSDNPDTTPVIMVVRDSQTFGIAESILITDNGFISTSEVVFQFAEGAIQNGQEFFVCGLYLENNGQISTVCDIAVNSFENRPEIINLDNIN